MRRVRVAPRAVRILAGAAGLLVCAGVLTACTTTGSSEPLTQSTTMLPPTTPSGSADGGLPALERVASWQVHHLGAGVLAVDAQGGRLWVTYSGGSDGASRGELVSYELTTGKVESRTTTGSFPAVLAVGKGAEWVGNSTGDGSQAHPWEPDTVEAFSARGKLLDSYHVTSPSSLAATGTRAVVFWGAGGPANVTFLRRGSTRTSTYRLPGTSAGGLEGNVIATCGEGIYAVTGGPGQRPWLLRVGHQKATRIGGLALPKGAATVACQPDGSPIVTAAGESEVLTGGTLTPLPALAGPLDAYLTSSSSRIWLVSSHEDSLTRIVHDEPTGTATIKLGGPGLVAADGQRVAVVTDHINGRKATVRVAIFQ